MVDVGSKIQIWSMWDSLHHLKGRGELSYTASLLILGFITATDLPSFAVATYLSILTLGAKFLEALIYKDDIVNKLFKSVPMTNR